MSDGRRWTPSETDTALMLLATNKDWPAYEALLLELCRPVTKFYLANQTEYAKVMCGRAAQKATTIWLIKNWKEEGE